MFKNMLENVKITPDFFTEIKLHLTFKQEEYKIKMAVFGIFQGQESRKIPRVTKYKILEVSKQNKIVKCIPSIIDMIDKWIKNNPIKFNSLIVAELTVMTLLISKENNPPQKSK